MSDDLQSSSQRHSGESERTRIGPYKIVGHLGTGGMGVVYRGFDERLERQVAIKQTHPKDAKSRMARRRFRREAKVAAQLNHPGIVTIHDILTTEEDDWLVMELVEGTTIHQMLKAGPLSVQQALSIGLDVTLALVYAHSKGVVHRDLKTSNVIITPEYRAKVLDFGLAKQVSVPYDSESSISVTGHPVGSPHAMSPEQARGQPLDFRSDLFSLGTMLYEMLTGISPFRASNIFETWTRVCTYQQPPAHKSSSASQALSDLVDKLLEKDPAHRPESAAEVARSLERLRDPNLEPTVSAPLAKDALTLTQGMARMLTHSAPPGRVSGELRQVTVLSCRLRPTTEAKSDLPPEELLEVQSTFEERVRRAAADFAGHVPDLVRHSALICFGYPDAHEDAPKQAVAAGLMLVEEIRRWRRQPGNLTSLGTSVGIHTGPGVASAASGQLVLGGTLDLASDLEALAGPDRVVISDAVEPLVREAFRLRGVPDGHAETEAPKAFRVLGGVDASALPLPESQLTPFVGRESALRLLTDLWQQVRHGQGQGVLVSGEAGIGKSRLAGALRGQLGHERARWLATQGSSYGKSSPFEPVRDLVRQLLEVERHDPTQRLAARIEEEIQRLGLPEASVAVLLQFLGPADRDPGPPFADSDTRRREFLHLLTTLVLKISGRQPTVLLIEDLHWFDASSLELVDELIPDLFSTSTLLLLTCRPDFEAPWEACERLTFLPLEQLDRVMAESMVEGLVPDHRLPTAIRRQILDTAEGNPLFIEELTQSLIDSGFGQARSRSSREARGKIPLPATLRDLLTVRLDRLGNAKEVAQVAAVAGREFSLHLLEAVCDSGPDALRQALQRMVKSKLIFRKGFSKRRRYAFKHALVQEAAYGSLLETDRCHWHAQMAEVLEEALEAAASTGRSPFPEATLPLVALHWSCSVNPRRPDVEKARKAVHFLTLCGQRQLEEGAHREAASQFQQVLRHLPYAELDDREQRELTVQLNLATAWRCSQGWGNPCIKEAYDRAKQLCLDLGDRPEFPQVLFGLWTYYLYHNHEQAHAAARDCLEAALASGQEPLVAQAYGALSSSQYWLGDLPGAIESSERSCLLARNMDDAQGAAYGQDPRILADQFAVWGFWYLGQDDEAVRRHHRTVALAKELGHPLTSAIALITTTNFERRRSDPAAVRRAADELIEMTRALDIPVYEFGGRFIRWWALAAEGRAGEVVDDIVHALEVAPDVVGTIALAHSSCLVAEVCRWAERPDQALEVVEEGLAIIHRQQERLVAAELHCLRAELFAERVADARGDKAAACRKTAEDAFREAYDQASKLLQVPFIDRATAGLLDLLRATERGEEAHAFESSSRRRREEILKETGRLVVRFGLESEEESR